MWVDIAIAGSVVISWIAVVVALVCLCKLRRQGRLTQQLYQRINHDIELANNGSIGMGQRLLSVEKKLKAAVQQHQFDPLQVDTQASQQSFQQSQLSQTLGDKQNNIYSSNGMNSEEFEPYTQAVRMLDSGFDADEVAKRCGLSHAETSLMQLMRSQLEVA